MQDDFEEYKRQKALEFESKNKGGISNLFGFSKSGEQKHVKLEESNSEED